MNSKWLLFLLLAAVLIVAGAYSKPHGKGNRHHPKKKNALYFKPHRYHPKNALAVGLSKPHGKGNRHHPKKKNTLGLSDLVNDLNGILKPIIDYTKCIRYNEVQNIKSLLSKKGASWTAEHNDFSCMTNTQLKSYLGATKPVVTEAAGSEVKVLSEAEVQSLPTGYIVNQTQPNCLGAIVNQGACGCCWAITAATVMADRVCMASSGRISGLSLSTQQITSCSQSNGCNGGSGTTSWGFINTNGLTTTSCYPYSSASFSQGVAPSCAATSTQCTDNSGTIGTTSTYKIQPSSSQYLVVPYSTSRSAADTIALIKQEIYNNGPVQAWYQVPREYYNYKTGVYVCQNCTDLIGNHFSRIVGWGVSNNVGYWIIANSWDVNWGNRGFVWFAQGQLGIESYIYGGTPILNTAAPTTTTRAPTPAPTTTTRAPGAPTAAPTTTTTRAPTAAPTPAPSTRAPTTTVVPTSTSTPSSTVQQTIANIISNLNRALGVTFVSNSAMMSNCQRQANFFVNNVEPYGSGGWTNSNNNWPTTRWTQIINGSPRPTKGGYELYGYNYDAMPTTFANSVSNSVVSTASSAPIANYLQVGIGIAQVPNSAQTYYVIDFAG